VLNKEICRQCWRKHLGSWPSEWDEDHEITETRAVDRLWKCWHGTDDMEWVGAHSDVPGECLYAVEHIVSATC
jgi:hypothetical protein